MSVMETSTLEMRHGYRRFFAWTAALSLLLMLAMITLEVRFPQGIRFSPQSSDTLADALGTRMAAMDVDFYDFQLLIMVVALVSCVASIVGLLIVAFIDSIESRKERRRRAIEARLRHPIAWNGQESAPARKPPRNAGLRALRKTVHELE
ncbi:hypothetical protein [Variovorax sp. YR216]|uniref:hypothetical protein n=1 Tax=Variovorax sp. YR216 TaxID=1882828 RepID=UPI0008970D4E|nr:hypothetical protein [Variovorax sp. YR216]SDZ96783.1 hypothetical protein SAMN05444680_10131 [Variovorax sp. YR216]